MEYPDNLDQVWSSLFALVPGMTVTLNFIFFKKKKKVIIIWSQYPNLYLFPMKSPN